MTTNASDFFGGGIPSSGEFTIPISTSLSSLVDVNITSPANTHSLVYDSYTGTWKNESIKYANIANTPTIYTTLNSLLDTTISTPLANDVLRYNGTKWVNTPLTGLMSLNDLTDTIISGILNSGNVIRYNGLNWVNAQLSHSDIDFTGFTATPNNAYSFSGLNDTAGVGVGNYFLRWNNAGTQVSYVQYVPAASVSGLQPVATVGTFDSLSDVTITSPTNNDILTYSGGSWINQSLALSAAPRIENAGNTAYVDTSINTDDITIQAGPVSGNVILNAAGAGTVIVGGSGDAVISTTANLKLSSSLDVYLQNLKYPSTDGTAGQVIVTDGLGNLSFASQTSGGAVDMNGLTDVTLSSPINGQYLVYNGSQWINQTISNPSGVAQLNDLSDVNPALSPASGKFFTYTGSFWDAHTLVLNDISTVNVTGPSTGQTLRYSGSQWVNSKLNYTDLLGTPPNPTTLGLSGLTDVNDAISPSTGHVLYFDGTDWKSQKLPANQITGLTISAVGQTGNYYDILNRPTVPVNLGDLANVNANTPSNAQVLTWNTGTSKWIASSPQITTTLISLTGDVNIAAPADKQHLIYDNATSKWRNTTFTVRLDNGKVEDVTITSPTVNQYLRYTGSAWANSTINYAHLSGTPTLVTTLESLTNVYEGGGFTTGQIPVYDSAGISGAGFYPKTPAYSRIQDTNNNTYVEVGTNDNITLQAGPDSGTGGNIVLLPNTTLNASAAVKIGANAKITDGASTTITSTMDVNITATGVNKKVSIQGIKYPSVDGTNGQALVTNGSGVLSFATIAGGSLTPKDYITGCEMVYYSSSSITVNPGTFMDSVNLTMFTFSSPISKDLKSAGGWQVGSGTSVRGRPTTVAWNNGSNNNGKFYFVFLIGNPSTGAVDIGVDISETAANLMADATVISNNFTRYRRIGMVLADQNVAANIQPFKQVGDRVMFDTPLLLKSFDSFPFDVDNGLDMSTYINIPTFNVLPTFHFFIRSNTAMPFLIMDKPHANMPSISDEMCDAICNDSMAAAPVFITKEFNVKMGVSSLTLKTTDDSTGIGEKVNMFLRSWIDTRK